MKRGYYLLLLLFLSFTVRAQENSRTIEGRVLSEDNKEAIGQAIIQDGDGNITLANTDGTFSIQVPNGSGEIMVRAVGFATKTVKIGADETQLTITLGELNKELNELVVVGYSDKKRSELTSSVSTVDSRKLHDVTSNDVGSMLQGKVSGLYSVNSSGEPGANAEMRIRGISSINATQSPLYVVDGIIGGNFDPNDVENITVLKDAAATAMYGSQANGGVIVVTTKRAQSEGMTVDAKITSGVRYPDYGKIKMMNGSEFYEYQKQLYRDYVPSESDNSYKIDLLKFYKDRPRELEDQNFNWLDATFKPAAVQNYHVGLSGKSKTNDYYFGLTYYDEDGTFVNTNYKRANLFGSLTTHFGGDNTVTNSINISGEKGRSYDYMDIYYAYLNLPWDNPFDEDGKPIYVDGNVPFKWWSRDKINPLHTADNSNHGYKGFDVNYDLKLDIRITDWLRFNSTNRLAASFNKFEDYTSPVTAGQNHDVGLLNGGNDLDYGGVFNQLLKFDFTMGRSQISGLAGIAYEVDKFENMGGSGRGLPFDLRVFNVVSRNLELSGYQDRSQIMSYLTQVNYNYANKYFVTASFREDGSTAFPKSKRWGAFPAASAAWLISNEDFLQDSKLISELKLRVSWGITGTQDIGASRYLGLFSLGSTYNNLTAATPLQLPSPNLTWESKHEQNVGVDLGLIDRITLTLDAYHNVTKDLLLQVSQPLSVGFETRWDNVGEIDNKGIEIGISSENVRNKNFSWSTDLNVSFNNNKLSGLPSSFVRTDSWGNSQIYRNGGNLYEFYMPVWRGVDEQTGAPLWEKVEKDEDGHVTGVATTSKYADATLQEVGSAVPTIQGGFTNYLSYKDFSLVINTLFVGGNKLYSNALRFAFNDGNEPLYNQIKFPKGYSIWEKPGDQATNPSPQNVANSTEPSSRYLYSGSFFQIRNVGLSYNARPLAKVLKLQDLTFSITADNVYTFTGFLGQDPQATISSNGDNLPGINDFKYPNNRQFLFNIALKF